MFMDWWAVFGPLPRFLRRFARGRSASKVWRLTTWVAGLGPSRDEIVRLLAAHGFPPGCHVRRLRIERSRAVAGWRPDYRRVLPLPRGERRSNPWIIPDTWKD